MKMLKPVLATVIFMLVVLMCTYVINPGTQLASFLISPFNMRGEDPISNLYGPALLIFIIAFYLKNFNGAFSRKCSLTALFALGMMASYMKTIVGISYYHGISAGTSIISLSFIVALVISLEVYVREKERYEEHYSKFLARFLTADLGLALILTIFAFFQGNSTIVHLIGVVAFMFVFTMYYERFNIARFYIREEHALAGFLGMEAARFHHHGIKHSGF